MVPVRNFNSLLDTVPDGDFGPKTEAAIKTLQYTTRCSTRRVGLGPARGICRVKLRK